MYAGNVLWWFFGDLLHEWAQLRLAVNSSMNQMKDDKDNFTVRVWLCFNAVTKFPCIRCSAWQIRQIASHIGSSAIYPVLKLLGPAHEASELQNRFNFWQRKDLTLMIRVITTYFTNLQVTNNILRSWINIQLNSTQYCKNAINACLINIVW